MTYLKAAWLIIRYGLSLESVTPLYTKYIGNWGGEATTYRFEAMDSDGLTVYKTVQKKPMTDFTICAKADHTVLIEKNSYDVAAIRILAKDEYGNVLPVCNDAVSFEVSGPVLLSISRGMHSLPISWKRAARASSLSCLLFSRKPMPQVTAASATLRE